MKFNFGNNLRKLRTQKHYTQEQAAELLNVSPKAISRWECGSTMPDVMMLPEIARIYCVTVDDLYKEKPIAYENYAHRLMSVYESTRSLNDFINAEREYADLIKRNEYTMKDLCIYAILYHYHMKDCKDKALELFGMGLNMGIDSDPDTYHWIQRQRMLMLSQIGESEKIIQEQREKFEEDPTDLYNHINLLVAYIFANDYEKALEIFLEAEKTFCDAPILYIYGGNVYKHFGMYDKAFACWNKSEKIDTDFCEAMWCKARCYEELGDYKSAHEVWTELIMWYESRGYEIEAEVPRRRAKECQPKIE